jgi:hypothetical protein
MEAFRQESPSPLPFFFPLGQCAVWPKMLCEEVRNTSYSSNEVLVDLPGNICTYLALGSECVCRQCQLLNHFLVDWNGGLDLAR